MNIAPLGLIVLLGFIQPILAASPPVEPPDEIPGETLQIPEFNNETPANARTGRLAIHAIQGTEGASPIGESSVEIQMHTRAGLLSTRQETLDEHGVIILDGLPLDTPFQPLVIVSHGGVTYQRAGTMMDASRPLQTIEVTCYDVTHEQPDWKVSLRHVFIQPAEHGVHVMELITLENPNTSTWLGLEDPVYAQKEQRVTTRFDLTAAIQGMKLGEGFHGWCCSTQTSSGLTNHLPLMPGSTKMSFEYIVPASADEARVDIVAPAWTDRLMIVVPKGLHIAGFEGIEFGGEQEMNATPVQFFVQSNQVKNQLASVTIHLHSESGADLAGTSDVTETRNLTKLVAGLGGGLLLLGTFVLILIRPTKAKPEGHA